MIQPGTAKRVGNAIVVQAIDGDRFQGIASTLARTVHEKKKREKDLRAEAAKANQELRRINHEANHVRLCGRVFSVGIAQTTPA